MSISIKFHHEIKLQNAYFSLKYYMLSKISYFQFVNQETLQKSIMIKNV